jgi:hypothetical protein
MHALGWTSAGVDAWPPGELAVVTDLALLVRPQCMLAVVPRLCQ